MEYSERRSFGDLEAEEDNDSPEGEAEKDNYELIDSIRDKFDGISDRLDEETEASIKDIFRIIKTNCGDDSEDEWIAKLRILDTDIISEFKKGNADVATSNLADLETQIETMRKK